MMQQSVCETCHNVLIAIRCALSGCQAVTDSFLEAGLPAVSFEKNNGRTMQDILHHIGFVYCTALALKLRDGGGSNTAPVCSSWVWVNRGPREGILG
eukprot:6225839-Alexandrium_andersonii.AAC.1